MIVDEKHEIPWWQQEINAGRVVRLILCLVLGVALAMVIHPYTPAGAQSRNLAIARAQGPAIETELRKDDRFFDVKAGVYTGNGGVIALFGSVYGGETELQALNEKMHAMKLPLPVRYQVQVYELTEEEKESMRNRK